MYLLESIRHRRAHLALLFLFLVAGLTAASAQTLVADDDSYGIPYGTPLLVEPFGVLDNDILDGEPAGELGAITELVADAVYGTLNLNPDGSFTYSPDTTFGGIDSFVYRAVFGAASAEATVSLSACSGGPDIYTCWNESAFLTKAADLGLVGFTEGFEDDEAWGGARSPFTSPFVVSNGIRWISNHPDPPADNEITTGPGPARTGSWAIFDGEHGYATGTPGECDVDAPPSYCFYHDGFTGVLEPGMSPLRGVGGYIVGTYGAKVAVSLDNADPVGGGQIVGGHQFFGVIDARPGGFSRFEFRELEGKVGNALYIFADDFTILTEGVAAVPEAAPLGASALFPGARPNPSRGQTTLSFTLAAHAGVQLVIYSPRGRLVRNLIDEHRGAGVHAVEWDGRDEAGRNVAAGLYFGRLVVTTDGEKDVQVTKIVLTR